MAEPGSDSPLFAGSTVVHVVGGATLLDRMGIDTEVNLIKKVRLEIAVNDSFVTPTVEAIIAGARSGKIGDGKIPPRPSGPP